MQSGGFRHPVLRFVVYGHIWLALGAALQVWWIGRVFFIEDLRTTVFVGCCTIAVYGVMRLFRLQSAPYSGTELLNWYASNRFLMWACVVLTGAVATIAIFPLLPTVLPVLVLPGIVSLFYVLPMRSDKGRVLGLRRIPYMKSLWIALVWASITVLLPMAVHPEAHPPRLVAALFLMQTSFVYALMVPFDIRDRPHDMASLRTLPQLVGDRTALRWGIGLAVLPIILLGWILIDPAMRTTTVWAVVLPMIGFAVSAILIARATTQRSEAYYLVWLDGTLVLVPLLGLVGLLF